VNKPEPPDQPQTLLQRLNNAVYRAVMWPFNRSLFDATPDFEDYKPGKVEHFITTSSIRHAGRWSSWLTSLITPGRAWGCLGLMVILVLLLALGI